MSVPGPVTGPCGGSWIDGADVQACCAGAGGTDAETVARVEVAALEASAALFVLSGRQFTGLCRSVVRPGADRCGCWGVPGVSPGVAWGLVAFDPVGFWRAGECGDRTSCPPLQVVKLAPYPVREIVEVKVGGAVLDPGAYRLDRYRELVRTDGGRWPGCQNQALADTEPGTFSVEYRHGVDPPELARLAASEVACQILAACPPVAADCVLPDGVVSIARQGITVNRDLTVTWLARAKDQARQGLHPTGLLNVDLFLRTYAPRPGRRPAVWSPDVRGFGRRTPLGAG